jgi:imidazole glycerol-phosphate synthase subunit HisH
MIAIINYGVGNLTSILNMHRRLGIDAVITDDVDVIEKSEKLLLPGVGHFDKCMENFNNSGLRPVIERKVQEEKTPILGICAGAQMMTRRSEEGIEKGLGWIEGDTVLFKFSNGTNLKIPHMGWTDIEMVKPSPLWRQMLEEPRFYFAHSYHFVLDNDEKATGKCNYGYDFTCAFQNDNVFGVQFHPEKSHRYGMKVLSNFSAL